MLPWLQRRPQSGDMASSWGDAPEEESNEDELFEMALRGIAHDIASGDVDRIAKALDMLCQIGQAKYDKD